MKTIEVTDEMYEKLIALSKEMTTQDMRYTKMPHMFQIREQKEVAAYDGCGEEIWVDNEGNILRDEKEMRDFVFQDIYDTYEDLANTSDEEIKKKAQAKVDNLDECELGDYLESLDDGWRKVSVTTESQYKNTFFTAKACQEHIDKNHYHYTKPDVFLNHAWRNPEMELVSEFLCNLTGKSNHK